jgi:hypothetical protein
LKTNHTVDSWLIVVGPVGNGNFVSQPKISCSLTGRPWATEGWTILGWLRAVERSWKIFKANWHRLDELVGRFKRDPKFALGVMRHSPDRR